VRLGMMVLRSSLEPRLGAGVFSCDRGGGIVDVVAQARGPEVSFAFAHAALVVAQAANAILGEANGELAHDVDGELLVGLIAVDHP
jgi:hypothetical protein